MKRFSLLSLCVVALWGTYGNAQDIILLNQDGEEVGVAKDVEEKKVSPAAAAKEPAADQESATIEGGVVKIIGPDGAVQQFNMSDARSISITRSTKTVIGEDGQPRTETQGKAILVGPDGVRREVDLENGAADTVSSTPVPKSWTIGVSYQAASPALRSQLQLDDDIGLVVKQVLGGSAAEKSGLKANDILVFAEQKPVTSQKQLSEILNEAGANGNDVSLTVLRGGEELSITVTPTERQTSGLVGGDLDLVLPRLKLLGRGGELLEPRGFGGGDVREVHREMMQEVREKMKRMREDMKALRQNDFDPFGANPFEDNPFK